jgi:cytoskeletal protein RodZ
MKNADKLFVILLIVVPLLSAIILSIALTQRKNVTPTDTSAESPSGTPVYQIQPISPTPKPTTTYIIAQATDTPLPTKISPTPRPTYTPGPTKIPPTPRPTYTPTPSPTGKGISISPIEAIQPEQTDLKSTVIAVLIIVFVFGGLVVLGSVIRKSKPASN